MLECAIGEHNQFETLAHRQAPHVSEQQINITGSTEPPNGDGEHCGRIVYRQHTSSQGGECSRDPTGTSADLQDASTFGE
jgi:hypothetical protein